MKFNELFKLWLGTCDLTRSQAARKLGCSIDSINNYVSNRSNPTPAREEFILEIINNEITEAYERWERNAEKKVR